MTSENANSIQYPASRSAVGAGKWDALIGGSDELPEPESLFASLQAAYTGLPPYLPDLLKLEHLLRSAGDRASDLSAPVDSLTINPSLVLQEFGWKGLAGLVGRGDAQAADPVNGPELVLVWIDPCTQLTRARPAVNDDLLALKISAENIAPASAAAAGGVSVGVIEAVIDAAVQQGILLAPASKLRRDPAVFRAARKSDEEFLATDSFSLQWHITQVCDLHCKHCYDRSERSPLTFEQATEILDDLLSFCRERHVRGAVSFTGGNPLLHPRFLDIYRAAADRGFGTAILGNPAPRERIEEIVRVQMPSFFQISLEGLRDHNDSIRGAGHFDRALAFLDVLRGLGVYAMVMLTLTRDNRDQVIPLAGILRGRADVFHFNRLALFGEGANLALPDKGRYRQFLEEYLAAAETNPVMGIKENLINVLRREKGIDLFGGCAGCGCGAAFNFVSLLADGEVHACRKLPSPIGNVFRRSLAEIYDSDEARRYRRGPAACRDCDVRPACGGCLASTLSHGLDIFTEKDPFCFKLHDVTPRP